MNLGEKITAYRKKLNLSQEELAGLILKILKAFGIFIIICFLVEIFAFFMFAYNKHEEREAFGEYSLTCILDDESYVYSIEYNKNFQALNIGGDAWIANHIDLNKYDDANQMVAHIEGYFKDHNGKCEIINDKK